MRIKLQKTYSFEIYFKVDHWRVTYFNFKFKVFHFLKIKCLLEMLLERKTYLKY